MRIWWQLVRLGFRLLYYEMAFTYDWVSRFVSLGAWRCWTRASLQFMPDDAHVLELAHGTGNLQLDMHERNIRTIGYDLSPNMGRIAYRKLQRKNIMPQLVRGDAQQLPFPSNSFDVIVTTFPTVFIIQPETLSEIYRCLTPNGTLIIVPNALFDGAGLFGKFLDVLYTITGQRGGEVESATPILDNANFQNIVTHQISCPRSIVTVITAHKLPISD